MSLVLNGSGTITGLSAGGLPDATITQAELATGVAGTGPAFSAYQSSAQTLSSATGTLIQLQSEEFDTASCFNNTGSTVGGIPAYSFMPNVAGYYQVSGGVAIGVVATPVIVYIYKNGSLFKQIFNPNASSTAAGYGSALIYLNGSTDYIGMYVYLPTGQALAAGVGYVYFQGAMVRAA